MSVATAKRITIDQPLSPLSTSIGMKALMAVTGIAFVGFILGHLAGNLQIFIGQDPFNSYAQFLHDLGKILWIERILVALFFIMHTIYGILVYFQNKNSRPISYAKMNPVQATYTSRTMIWTGLGVMLFVVYHLLHFTLIVTNPEYAGLKDSLGRFDVYSMVILGFQNPLISFVYILAMALVSFHLSHAMPSLFQTLGLIHRKLRDKEKNIGRIFGWIIFLGYVSIPIGVLVGIIKLPKGGM